ncbi:MAG: glycosyl transferase [Flavobacteriaceae bacterium]|nr:glycosyl transferase [Flavobacteriaceae bacterium]|tara:strand:- start:904 stop:1815 length:912 start_codon:yes stop_codon:yes gene_type:complete
MTVYAPIALFVYNRFTHIKKVVESIKKNSISKKSNIFIFSDFSNDDIEQNKIKKIRKYLKNLKGFKKIKIIERKHNMGTSKNILDGLNEIFKKYNRCIIIEDDILVSKDFLYQMNYCLEKFRNFKNIASVEGYMYPVQFKKNTPNYFLLKGTGCWGWATWRRSWKNYEDSAHKLLNKFHGKKELVYDFDYYNSYPYYRMLKKQKWSKKKSWAVKWYASNFLKNNYTIYFKNTLVKNIGLDGSGENCKIDYQINQKKFNNLKFKIEINDKPDENVIVKKDIAKYLKKKFSLNNKLNFIIKKLIP